MKQIWWHIRDSYDSEPSQSIRQVMDFITNDNEFRIIPPLSTVSNDNKMRINGNFYGLKVFARNSQLKELGYIWHDDCILCNIDLNRFPRPSSSLCIANPIFNDSRYRHVKIEVEYTIPIPTIADHYGDPELVHIINRIFSPKKKVSLKIKGQIQPEFTITLPKGWILSRKSDSIMCSLTYRKSDGSVEKIPNDDNEINGCPLEYRCVPENVDGRWKYSLLFYFPKDYFDEKSRDSSFELNYISAIAWDAFLLSIILPIIFTIVSSIILVCAVSKCFIPINFAPSVYLALAGMLLSFIFVYVSYYQNGYHLTRPSYFIGSFAITVAAIALGVLRCSM